MRFKDQETKMELRPARGTTVEGSLDFITLP